MTTTITVIHGILVNVIIEKNENYPETLQVERKTSKS
jgi:hypothetical protein